MNESATFSHQTAKQLIRPQPLLVLSPTRLASNRKTIKTTTALVAVITNKSRIKPKNNKTTTALVGVITNKTRIKPKNNKTTTALVGVITNKSRIKPKNN